MIVISGDYGQLGNRLVVYANMLASARTHGWRIANPAFEPYAPYFEGTRRTASRRLAPLIGRSADLTARYASQYRRRLGRWPPLVRVLDIGWSEPCDLDGPEFRGLARQRGLLIARGWLYRARRTFHEQADAIRRHFAPVEPHRGNVARLLGQARQDADVVVGIHVRQGDYRGFEGGRYYYETGQYTRLMRRVMELHPGRRVAFVVCSNVPQPRGAFADMPVAYGTNHLIEDLYTLAGCDYLLGPPSTFTQWASFYGGVPLYAVTDPQAGFGTETFRAPVDVN